MIAIIYKYRLGIILSCLALLFIFAVSQGQFVAHFVKKYRAGTLFEDEARLELVRNRWEMMLQQEQQRCDFTYSAWTAGNYDVVGPGVAPTATGNHLSSTDQCLFRDHIERTRSDAWEYSPPDIKKQFKQLYRSLGIYD